MHLRRILVVAGALLLVPALSAGPALAATHAWGQVIEVPGTAALNSTAFPYGLTEAVSCPSSGNCGAGGGYADSGGEQGFVVSQTAGTWGQAIPVPGLAALNSGGYAYVTSISCASAGNCTAGGTYRDSSKDGQSFVVTQTAGTWGQAIEVPGTAALNAGGGVLAGVASVSCASAGNCTALGSYQDSSGHYQPFAATQTAGTWGQAVELPGAAARDILPVSIPVSCTAPGTCIAGGGGSTAFVARERDGAWSDAQLIPGLATLNVDGQAVASSVSCPSAGNCGVVGYYFAANGWPKGFLATEQNGTWGRAEQVPGLSALGNDISSNAVTISCPSAGNCLAGGSYTYTSEVTQAFAVTESGGVWANAVTVPGMSSLNKGYASVNSVSCASKGNCAIGGYYESGLTNRTTRPFVASQVGGVLQGAQKLPGIGKLNPVDAPSTVVSVSCARGGTCALGGDYDTSNTIVALQAMVDSQE